MIPNDIYYEYSLYNVIYLQLLYGNYFISTQQIIQFTNSISKRLYLTIQIQTLEMGNVHICVITLLRL